LLWQWHINIIDFFTVSAVLRVVTMMTNLISSSDNWTYDIHAGAAALLSDHKSRYVDNISVELQSVHNAVVGRNSHLFLTKRHTHCIVAIYIIRVRTGLHDIGKSKYWQCALRREKGSEAAAGNGRNCARGFTTAVVYRYIRLAGRPTAHDTRPHYRTVAFPPSMTNDRQSRMVAEINCLVCDHNRQLCAAGRPAGSE